MSCKIVLTQDHEGRRLDRTIRSIWPALPLSVIMRAIRKGEVRVDVTRAREGALRVQGGQELYVPWEEPGKETDFFLHTPRHDRPRPLAVLWRDKNIAVIDKPVDLLVQPDVKGGDSVITRVWEIFGFGGPGFAPAAVHRLDRNTTGALVVALSGEALRELERLFKERLVSKRYLAVVVGTLPEKGMIDVPLLKDEANNIVRTGAGKNATTCYERLAAGGGLSLASIKLLTGRTHQARVHMTYAGYPILGDRKYGNIEINRRCGSEAKRPLLHSYELGFPKKLSGTLVDLAGKVFRAPVPGDMATLLRKRGWFLPE
ncbi:MAG: RluA family pseudouridine synthase [Synergistaceae bacterium]|jgi:23S rRNA pseudouridine955/2504/2580 synthase|nr:RluA family pseudouridine synthase [Synergistaceae bacterium]